MTQENREKLIKVMMVDAMNLLVCVCISCMNIRWILEYIILGGWYYALVVANAACLIMLTRSGITSLEFICDEIKMLIVDE